MRSKSVRVMSPASRRAWLRSDGLAVVGRGFLRRLREQALASEHVGEGLTNGEDELALLVVVLALGFVGGRRCAVETPAAFLSAFEEAGDVGGVVVGVTAVVVDLRQGDALAEQCQGRILAQAGGDLCRLDWRRRAGGRRSGWDCRGGRGQRPVAV